MPGQEPLREQNMPDQSMTRRQFVAARILSQCDRQTSRMHEAQILADFFGLIFDAIAGRGKEDGNFARRNKISEGRSSLRKTTAKRQCAGKVMGMAKSDAKRHRRPPHISR